ncbi:uncharacterized protein [Miscanthus floridulus]|uniref:uncharacterized protein n=1 Tax=Miscanthus floridulus TaxID=154761 RepID=UPI003458ADD0
MDRPAEPIHRPAEPIHGPPPSRTLRHQICPLLVESGRLLAESDRCSPDLAVACLRREGAARGRRKRRQREEDAGSAAGGEVGARSAAVNEVGARSAARDEMGAGSAIGDEVGAGSTAGDEVGAGLAAGDEVGARSTAGEEVGADPRPHECCRGWRDVGHRRGGSEEGRWRGWRDREEGRATKGGRERVEAGREWREWREGATGWQWGGAWRRDGEGEGRGVTCERECRDGERVPQGRALGGAAGRVKP